LLHRQGWLLRVVALAVIAQLRLRLASPLVWLLRRLHSLKGVKQLVKCFVLLFFVADHDSLRRRLHQCFQLFHLTQVAAVPGHQRLERLNVSRVLHDCRPVCIASRRIQLLLVVGGSCFVLSQETIAVIGFGVGSAFVTLVSHWVVLTRLSRLVRLRFDDRAPISAHRAVDTVADVVSLLEHILGHRH